MKRLPKADEAQPPSGPFFRGLSAGPLSEELNEQ